MPEASKFHPVGNLVDSRQSYFFSSVSSVGASFFALAALIVVNLWEDLGGIAFGVELSSSVVVILRPE